MTWSSSSGMGSRGRNRGNCRIKYKKYIDETKILVL
ncbi:hypothetical protein RUMOBE_00301 [Blautia obeum ATCC 29174]|uniref:Uncharacterized protein n=1 Tax=Blautia obeum ATCC 29174 TaxID=411459 RepID=A5ZMT4_9FIRM|nr:hypothetical protein RUMOBE_00301 [Blautia obeum ATCC 29174]